jgi:hypothetical protein
MARFYLCTIPAQSFAIHKGNPRGVFFNDNLETKVCSIQDESDWALIRQIT